MSLENEILGRIDADQLAAQVGTDPQTARAAAEDAIRLLLAGMHHNAQNPEGESALAGALQEHAQASQLFGPDVDDATVDLGQVDTTDGEKIAGHVLGEGGVQQFSGSQFGSGSSGQSELMGKVIKYLAPIVLAYIAKRITQGQGSVLDESRSNPQGGGGILGQILGQVLGGRPGADVQQPQVQQPAQTQDTAPFDTPSTGGDGELRMDDGSGGTVGGQTPHQQEQVPQQRSQGGILGQILGGMFGR